MELVKKSSPKLMANTNMHCPNCGENKWEAADEFRIKPEGMGICNACGFVSYPAKWKSKEEIKAHYRTAYRNPPTHSNLFACERKNHFHNKFLQEVFHSWRERGLENPRVLDVGAAFGSALAFIRSVFPKAEVYGTELTTSMRRNAFYEYGIKLTEEIDETVEYDLIMSYKVLEHQVDPDLELRRYVRLLAPTGLLYMSVPTWFNSLYNFGAAGFDLEYYFDPNHINVWSQEMFEGMLERAGFEITKNDQVIYSSTYLAKVSPKVSTRDVVRISPEVVRSNLARIKAAYLAAQDNLFEEAVKLWPDYPQAHISNAEMKRKLLTEKGWDVFKEQIIDRALADCPNSTDTYIMATDFAMRAGKFDEATKYAETALMRKPENPVSLNQLTNTMREMALKATTAKEKMHYFVQAREVANHLRRVSSQHYREASDLVMFYNAKLPFKGENAEVEVKKEETRETEPAL